MTPSPFSEICGWMQGSFGYLRPLYTCGEPCLTGIHNAIVNNWPGSVHASIRLIRASSPEPFVIVGRCCAPIESLPRPVSKCNLTTMKCSVKHMYRNDVKNSGSTNVASRSLWVGLRRA